MDLVVGVVLAVAILAAYVTWLAGRLDRLSSRCQATEAALDAHLARRAASALGVAAQAGRSRDLDPVSAAALHAAAEAALAPSLRTQPAGQTERERCESALSRVLRATVPAVVPSTVPSAIPRGASSDTDNSRNGPRDPATASSVAELRAAVAKTALARQFHNDAVRDWRAFRRRPVVRLLRLASRRVPPAYAEFDDAAETTSK